MSEGLRFACQPGCTECCQQKGFVYLTELDVPRMAAYLGMTPAGFEARYVYRTRHRIRLRIPPDSNCSFLKNDGCSIHPAKPTQCRTFPFWPELVETRGEWQKTARYCPGIGQGPLVQIESIREQSKEMIEGYPGIY